MREYYADIVRNTAGDVVEGATVTVYLAGTLTVAAIYENSTDVIAVANILTDVNGKFTFYISYSDYSPAQLFDITIVKGAASQTYEDVRIFGHGILVSGNDSTPGFLNGKLIAGSGISFTEGSDGGNETLTLAISGASSKVSSNDTTFGYLNGKLVAGTGITLTEGSNGGDETLTIAEDSGIAVVTATRDMTTDSGTQEITIGFPAKGIIVIANIGGNAAYSFGMATATLDGQIYNNHNASAYSYGNAGSLVALLTAGGTSQVATVSVWGSTSITLNWVKSGSPTGTATLYIMAFR